MRGENITPEEAYEALSHYVRIDRESSDQPQVWLENIVDAVTERYYDAAADSTITNRRGYINALIWDVLTTQELINEEMRAGFPMYSTAA